MGQGWRPTTREGFRRPSSKDAVVALGWGQYWHLHFTDGKAEAHGFCISQLSVCNKLAPRLITQNSNHFLFLCVCRSAWLAWARLGWAGLTGLHPALGSEGGPAEVWLRGTASFCHIWSLVLQQASLAAGREWRPAGPLRPGSERGDATFAGCFGPKQVTRPIQIQGEAPTLPVLGGSCQVTLGGGVSREGMLGGGVSREGTLGGGVSREGWAFGPGVQAVGSVEAQRRDHQMRLAGQGRFLAGGGTLQSLPISVFYKVWFLC